MTPDPLLARLCQVIDSAPEPRTLFRGAAPLLHELTACERVVLVLPADGPGAGRGFAAEFADAPRFFDVSAESDREAAGATDAERRALFGHGYSTCVRLPLHSANTLVGVLGLA